MATWEARAEDLLFEGETVEDSVTVGENGVVVTSHRVLVFTPANAGQNYRHVDRPNVEGVAVTTRGRRSLLWPGAKAGGAGILLAGAGATTSLDGLIPVSSVQSGTSAAPGVARVLSILSVVQRVLALLDDLALVVGLALVTASLGAFGFYLSSREPQVVLRVAGDDDVRLPTETPRVGSELEDALGPTRATRRR